MNAVVEKIIHSDAPTKARANTLLQTGAKTLPVLPKDSTDRNRTSPFAFTGNRFEFRMVGSSQNIAGPNIVLDTIVGKTLKEFADTIERAEDVNKAIDEWIRTTLKEHERIIFNGDGYSDKWVKEAEKRGLPNIKHTVEAVDVLSDEKVKELFAESGVLTPSELKSRAEIKYSNYASQVFIDAKTMSHMARKLYIPAVNAYFTSLVKEAKACKEIGIDAPKSTMDSIKKISGILDEVVLATDKLDEAVSSCHVSGRDKAVYARDLLLPLMASLRAPVDELETIVSKAYWPVPSYGDLLFHIN